MKFKINEEEIKEKEIADLKSKKNKKTKDLQNFNKELDNTTKLLNTTTNSLYVGFIIVNFPRTLKEAEQLEKYFTGFESEYKKEPDINEKKLYSFGNIVDINVKNKKNKNGDYSLFDFFIEFKISSNEVDRRYNGCKYDPSNGKVYHTDDNPPPKEDKKKESKYITGLPNVSKEEIYKEKANYEKNIKNLERLYKAMNNGFNVVYKKIDQSDINYIHNINDTLENNISEFIFNNYYNNIDNILNNINNNSISDKNKDIITTSSIPQEKEDNLNNSIEHIRNVNSFINNKFYEDLLSFLDEFNKYYIMTIKNFIHFIGKQKEHIIKYLTAIQNDFISYLNRKTEKTEIAKIYIEKYNSLVENHPEIKNNLTAYNELSGDIKDVMKSIWINIQKKKNNDVNYLQNLKKSGQKEKEINIFWEFILLIIDTEVQKYLTICEVIVKFYLSKTGFFNNENVDNKTKNNNNKFKIDYKEYLFEEIDLPVDFFNKINNSTELKYIEKKKSNNQMNESENKKENNNNADSDGKINDNLNKTKSKNKNNRKKNMEEKMDIIFMNVLKIIIREDELIKEYMQIIKDNIIIYYRERKPSVKMLTNNSSIEGSPRKKASTTNYNIRSIQRKKMMKKNKANEMIDNVTYEDIINQINNEKRKLKYRLMFLKYYTIRYSNIINECYNETYNAMDDLIIMSVRNQNNTLNEFMNYLTKALNNFMPDISLDDFEFDSYDIYRRYKKDINSLYDKMKFNAIYNIDRFQIGILNDDKKKIGNEVIVSEEEMPYVQLYAYNLNDLIYIYYYIKTFGVETCNFLVKYDIVKEILLHQYFTKKKYGVYDNKNDNNNNNNDNNFNTYNNNALNLFLSEENNGICKKILFSSNVNYINFLNRFSVYNNNYININELFTSLLLLGSQLISSDTFIDLIKEYLPENKKESKNIYLTKEEFLKLPMWFEKDDYLNVLVDSKEQENYLDITKYCYNGENYENEENNNIDNKNKPIKINAIKEAIFEINSEDNILDFNKIILLLNKINNIEEIKEEKKSDDKKNQIISDTDNNNLINEEANKNEIYNSKGRETDSKITLSVQSELDAKRMKKHHDNKENINNIFNALFIN